MEGWVGGRVFPGGQRGMRPLGFGYLFLGSRLGEVGPLWAGLGWLLVWTGCCWGHLRGQSGLCHRWWLACWADLLQPRLGWGRSPHWLQLGWSFHLHWVAVGDGFGVGLEFGVLPRWRCGWSCFGVE